MTTQKDNSGVLFPNSYKTTDRHPDFKGKALIGGTEYKLSGWKNYSKSDGSEYISVKVEQMEEYVVPESFPTRPSAPSAPKVKPDENDIPF